MTDANAEPVTVATMEVKVEPDGDMHRVAVYVEGKFHDAVGGFKTFDQAVAAAKDFTDSVLSLPGVTEAKVQ